MAERQRYASPRPALTVAAVALASLISSTAVTQLKDVKLSAEATRGKYLVQIAGCNDCHTSGYTSSAGKVEEKLWLTGDKLGWRGPWGTTYESRPPMPWFNLRHMTDRDVKAIFAYLKHLGPAGQAAPQYVPADETPGGPFVQFPSAPK